MTIDEAIKISEGNKILFELSGDTLAAKATQLGIGAIQQIAQMRLLGISPIAELLPGETED